MQIKQSVAIVTGASSGIGEATVRLLAQKGAKVGLVARSKAKLEKLSAEFPGSFVYVCDMTKPLQIEAMVHAVWKHFGRIDILVNNAGQGYDASIENIDIETFHSIFDLDVVGPLVAMQQVIPIMKKQGGGTIINISSGTALMALPNMAAYSSLKRAVAGISLSARSEYEKDNIIISVVYPFITATDFEKNTIKDGDTEWSDDRSERDIPPADSPEYAAEKILEAISGGAAEVFAHPWMDRTKGK